MMVNFHNDQSAGPIGRQSWRRDKDGRGVWLCCPNCGTPSKLDAGHIILEDGRVIPAVVCPAICGFHESITLAGWNPPALLEDL